VSLLAAGCASPGVAEPNGWEWAQKVPAIPSPNIPSRSFSIVDFGAVGDGKTDATAAISTAIAKCAEAGGGRVIVPAGKFLTGPIVFKNHVELHLEKNATLLCSDDIDHFPMHPHGGSGSNTFITSATSSYADWIWADGCHDIAITGEGTLDGLGQKWWDKYKRRPGATTQPSQLYPHRPHMIVFNNCDRVLVRGITLTNSPMFHLVPQQCRDVRIENCRFISPDESPNTDGIDPSGRNILITGCYFDVGDDCIAVKPQAPFDGEHLSVEDLYVTNCTFKHGHGLSIGGQTPGGLQRMLVRDCTFDGTDAGIRMKANRGTGGPVQDLVYENITMNNVKVPILITSFYPRVPPHPELDPPRAVSVNTPIWRRIRIRNLVSKNSPEAGRAAQRADRRRKGLQNFPRHERAFC
jgi:polygalacturonase